jgi:hypothetical protein
VTRLGREALLEGSLLGVEASKRDIECVELPVTIRASIVHVTRYSQRAKGMTMSCPSGYVQGHYVQSENSII